MKPRNNFERRAAAVSRLLPEPTKAQKEYAYQHSCKHTALIRSKYSYECICMECGEKFTVQPIDELAASLMDSTVTCPHCGRQLEVVRSPRRLSRKRDISTFQIITTKREFQIVRTFQVLQWTEPCKPAEYDLQEVSQTYIVPNRKNIVIAKSRATLCHYNDIYNYESEMTIKANPDYYDLWPIAIWPHYRVLPEIKRNGWCKELRDLYPVVSLRLLLSDPKYETLAKTKRFDIWRGLDVPQVHSHWDQVKMLIRHNYHPSDFSMWYDTILMAEQLKLDSHSPKYVLPADLKAMHDMLNKRIQAKRKREERERERREIAAKKEYEEQFMKLNAPLLAIVIAVGDITIKPLQNYQEYVEEGDKMHHCVETYWKRRGSFILSAKDDKGKRLATIELDRKSFHVGQCRAANNEKPARYDEICDILDTHRQDFLRVARKMKPRAKKTQIINP